jgi:hypothetical protein
MNMVHRALPSVRRLDDEAVRYVRTEYGERDASWLSSTAVRDSCLRLPGETGSMTGTGLIKSSAMTRGQPSHCCPVISTLSDEHLLNGFSPRGELAGER